MPAPSHRVFPAYWDEVNRTAAVRQRPLSFFLPARVRLPVETQPLRCPDTTSSRREIALLPAATRYAQHRFPQVRGAGRASRGELRLPVRTPSPLQESSSSDSNPGQES